MNNFKLVFNLKQHTPIIHFQHDQRGATLRATEVKPKLDRFIIKKKGGWANNIPADWKLINDEKDKKNLNYKIKITAKAKDNDVSGLIEKYYQDRRGRSRREKFPSFFGLMGEESGKDSKEFMFHQNIEVTILCFVPELLAHIKEQLPAFFMHHNFGNRQSKGFGSFFPEDIATYPITPLKFRFTVDVNKVTPHRLDYMDGRPANRFFQYFQLFDTITLFYNTLRSGLNQYDKGNESIYFKSLLFLYAKEKLNAQWDKKRIKEVFYPRNLTEQKAKNRHSEALHFNSRESYLMRDLLGLASESKWHAEYKDMIKTESVTKAIERFTSPILFKPIEVEPGIFHVFFEGNQEEVNKMVNQKFRISNRRRNFEINTPPKFDINDFLKFAVNIDVRAHAQAKYGKRFSYDIELLSKIYQEIKLNIMEI